MLKAQTQLQHWTGQQEKDDHVTSEVLTEVRMWIVISWVDAAKF
jgi:hypothetical protein